MAQLKEALNCERLFALIHRTWDCLTRAPLTPNCHRRVDAGLVEQLNWFAATTMMPSHTTILLGIDPSLAREITGEMFDLPNDRVSDADTVDAVGELSNIIAGCVKTEFALQDQMQTPIRLAQPQLTQLLQDCTVIAEVFAESERRLLYAALVAENAAGNNPETLQNWPTREG